MDNESHGWKRTDRGGFIERECLLFEAGDYPDRGVTISAENLLSIAKNTPSKVPVKVEHLAESPFDGALGTIGQLRVAGNSLWGTLRQPAEAWQFVQRAGAKALSIALDTVGWRLSEVSFVCRPRVANAQVFQADNRAQSPGCALFHLDLPAPVDGWRSHEEAQDMVSVRQFADGLIQYVRGVLGNDLPGDLNASARQAESFSAEASALAEERRAIQAERIAHRIDSLKRKGLIRATSRVEDSARAIFAFGVTNVVQFGGESVRVDDLFEQFLIANGSVVPMGEIAHAGPESGGATDRLLTLAREAARRDQLPYHTAFSQVSSANPDLARAAREESLQS